MGLLIIPLLVTLIVVPAPGPPAQVLADFSRFSSEINREVSLVGADGIVHEGVVTAATPDDLTMRFGRGSQVFSRVDVTSAERLTDGRRDGFVKGAIFGALVGAMVAEYYDSHTDRLRVVATSLGFYGGIGYLIDAAQTHREPIYRAPSPSPALSAKLSIRF